MVYDDMVVAVPKRRVGIELREWRMWRGVRKDMEVIFMDLGDGLIEGTDWGLEVVGDQTSLGLEVWIMILRFRESINALVEAILS